MNQIFVTKSKYLIKKRVYVRESLFFFKSRCVSHIVPKVCTLRLYDLYTRGAHRFDLDLK